MDLGEIRIRTTIYLKEQEKFIFLFHKNPSVLQKIVVLNNKPALP